jgi:transcriptional regulator with GAF, ATPase, and Fis domain
MAIQVWWDSVGVHDTNAREVIQTLRRNEVTAKPWTTRADHGIVLVLLAGDAHAAADRIAQIRRGHPLRCVAIALGPRADVPLPECSALLGAGADEVLAWSDAGPGGVAALLARWREVDASLNSDLVRTNLIGESPAWRSFLRELVEAAGFSAAPILIRGETGTGKELAARLVHAIDARAPKGDLVVCDCTTIVPELVGSELFGHVRGSFTGSIGPRDGALALADGGTLFLDEIGELPLDLQGHLLRAVQEQTYKPVGGNEWRRSSFRLVCATNRDLLAEVERGRFRRDLYYRLAGAVCLAPPLRERPEDVVPLARHFLREFLRVPDAPAISSALSAYLQAREYPGNVRDLRRLVQSIARKYLGVGAVTLGTVPPIERGTIEPSGRAWTGTPLDAWVGSALDAGVGLRDIGRAAEDTAIRLAVARSGSVRAAAEELGVTPRAIQMRQAQQRRDPDAAPIDHESAEDEPSPRATLAVLSNGVIRGFDSAPRA